MGKLTVYLNESYKKSNGTVAVYIYTYLLKEKVWFNTGVSVDPNKWDPKKKRIKGSSKTVKDNNLIIDSCLSRLNDVFVRYRLQHKELTPDLLKKEYKTPSTYIDFYDFFERTKTEKDKILSPDTIKLHGSVLKKMKDYQKQLMFSEITVEWLNGYKHYLKGTLKNNANTIEKNMGVIKAYLNEAKRLKIISDNPFEHLKIKRISPDRVFLTEAELNKLIDLYKKAWLQPNQQRVLRYFLFGCFTGLRISDVKQVTHDDIIDNTLIFAPKKTKTKIVRVPLTKPALRLIKDANPLRSFGVIFDTYCDQYTNRQLKKICDAVGISKHVTTHSARHTFATLFLSKTKNLAALQKLLGHTNISETMTYAHILTEDIKDEMDVFNGFEI